MKALRLATLAGASLCALFAQPRLMYSSFFGGNGAEVVTASTVDEEGRLWITGYTVSNADFPLTEVRFRDANAGERDIFVAQIDTTFAGPTSIRYATFIGGAASDQPTCIAVRGGFVYVGGITNSIDFPLAGLAAQGSPGTNQDGFVLKLDPTKGGAEAMVYSTYIGGDGLDRVNAITTDGERIYVAGYTTSQNFPTTGGAIQAANRGNGDAFLAVYDPRFPTAQATLTYSGILGGVGVDSASAIGVDAQGGIYVTGWTSSGDFPVTSNARQSGFAGGTDVFLTKIDLTRPGTPAYSTFIGGAGQEVPNSIAIQGVGTMAIVGQTLSTDFPILGEAPQREARGGGDAFVLRMNLDNAPAQAITFSTLLGGSSGDVAMSVANAPNGALVVSGYTLSTNFPTQGGALQTAAAGVVDVFLTKLSPATGAIEYSGVIGGTSIDFAVGAHAVAPTNACEFVLAGQTQSRSWVVTDNAAQERLNGLSDAVAVRVNLCNGN